MRICSNFLSQRTLLALAIFTCAGATTLNAQAFASSGTTAGSTTPISNKPATAWHDTQLPEDKLINADVRDGVLVVDGLVGKVHLNYTIKHAGYLYFYVPGVGTAVVSRVQMGSAEKVKDAFHGNTLTFNVDGHSFELTNQGSILNDKGGKMDAYVSLDTKTEGIDRSPMMGYGNTTRAPYVWPLSAPEAKDTYAHFVQPPPMPANLLPRTQPTAVVDTRSVDQSNQ